MQGAALRCVGHDVHGHDDELGFEWAREDFFYAMQSKYTYPSCSSHEHVSRRKLVSNSDLEEKHHPVNFECGVAINSGEDANLRGFRGKGIPVSNQSFTTRARQYSTEMT
jgi:hypothetical protein